MIFKIVPREKWPGGWFCSEHDDKHHKKIDIEMRHQFIYVVPYEIGQKARIPKNTFDQDKAAAYLIELKRQLDNTIRKFVGKQGIHPPETTLPVQVSFTEKKGLFLDHTHINRLEDREKKKESRRNCTRVELTKTTSNEKPTRTIETREPTHYESFYSEPKSFEPPSRFVRKSEFHEMTDKKLERENADINPYVLWSFPTSTFFTDERFQSHNENMTKRKKMEKLGKFDYNDVISMRHYKSMVQDVEDGDDIIHALQDQQQRYMCNLGVQDCIHIGKHLDWSNK